VGPVFYGQGEQFSGIRQRGRRDEITNITARMYICKLKDYWLEYFGQPIYDVNLGSNDYKLLLFRDLRISRRFLLIQE